MDKQELFLEQNCAYCLSKMKLLYKSYKDYTENDMKYTSFVFSLGYATLITMFSTLHNNLVIMEKAIFIFLLGISIFVFIVNEIWKMRIGMKLNEYRNFLWQKNFNGELPLNEVELRFFNFEVGVFANYFKIYPTLFWVGLVAGVITALYLFYLTIKFIFLS